MFSDSSVNSGNSFKDLRKFVTSRENPASWSGKSSASISGTTGRAMCGRARCLTLLRLLLLGFTIASFAWRETLRGKRSAAFSRKRKSTEAMRFLSWNEEERSPTDEPSCREALAKFRSCRLFTWSAIRIHIIKKQSIGESSTNMRH